MLEMGPSVASIQLPNCIASAYDGHEVLSFKRLLQLSSGVKSVRVPNNRNYICKCVIFDS